MIRQINKNLRYLSPIIIENLDSFLVKNIFENNKTKFRHRVINRFRTDVFNTFSPEFTLTPTVKYYNRTVVDVEITLHRTYTPKIKLWCLYDNNKKQDYVTMKVSEVNIPLLNFLKLLEIEQEEFNNRLQKIILGII